MTYPSVPDCLCDHKGSKFIVPLHLLNVTGSVTNPANGFIKLFFKNNILTSKNSTGLEKNLVLDTLLTGLSVSPVAVPIVATDSIIQAFGKLQGTINNLEIAYVRCYCPSTDRMFFLGVHESMTNAKDAITSLCQIPVKLKDNLLSINRQGEMFSFNFDETGTNMLKNNLLTKEDCENEK